MKINCRLQPKLVLRVVYQEQVPLVLGFRSIRRGLIVLYTRFHTRALDLRANDLKRNQNY